MGLKIKSFTVSKLEDIAMYIDLNRPVLLGVRDGGTGCYNTSHAMVATGYKKDGTGKVTELYVNDPLGSWAVFTESPSCIAAAFAIFP
jgi:hypothetical protein